MGKTKPVKTLKIAMSIPSEGHTLPEAYDNHLLQAFHLGKLETERRLTNAPIQYEFHWYSIGRIFTPLARESLIQQALNAGMDYILMYDDDMILPIDMVDVMLQDVLEHPDIDVLAPLAFMRNAPHYAVMYTTREGYDPTRHEQYFKNEWVKNYPRDQLVECDAVGFGAVLIKMDMVKKMSPPYCMSALGTGEDIYFCMKAKKDTNARIFMDTRIKLGHLSNPRIIDEEYFDTWRKEHKHEIVETLHKYTKIER